MKIRDYDPASLLRTDADIATYLNDAYEDNDPMVFIIALGDVAKIKGISVISKATGLNRESLYKTFSGKVKPKWDTVAKVLKALDVHLQAA